MNRIPGWPWCSKLATSLTVNSFMLSRVGELLRLGLAYLPKEIFYLGKHIGKL